MSSYSIGGRPLQPRTSTNLAREVFAPLGGVLEVGAVNATGTWVLADVSVGEFLARRHADVERLMDGVRKACGFDDAAMRMADEVGWFRDYSVEAAHLLLWSAGVTGVPDPIERLDEPLAVRRMCRMAADLQLTKFLHAVITTAVAARTEPRRGAAAIVDVLTTACDLADATGGVVPAQVYRTWRVAHLPGVLHPQSDAPEYGRAGFRAYDEELEGLLLGG
ncbi:hypothetical protein [Streptomyces justiciae]|uniref:Uncharacterized protein n=1 Tax=Streptomyces justiciae TaxID=2780140 RepID=A0ABU3M5M4_9ACTN|nr:hypothetical protein [Streptomyces justiciae]MDT7846807.1 hypothetical protein [Streptomyces justiciae]